MTQDLKSFFVPDSHFGLCTFAGLRAEQLFSIKFPENFSEYIDCFERLFNYLVCRFEKEDLVKLRSIVSKSQPEYE